MMADSYVSALCIAFQGEGPALEKSIADLAQLLNGETEILPERFLKQMDGWTEGMCLCLSDRAICNRRGVKLRRWFMPFMSTDS